MLRLLALRVALVVMLLAPGCYRSHERVRVPARDAGVVRDATLARDAGTPDAGPPRELRWREIATGPEPHPDARMHHFAVIDESTDRMIVLGGIDPYCCGSPGFRNDVWALDLTTDTWTLLGELSRPLLGTTAVEAALDVERNRVVIVGAVSDFGGSPPSNVSVDLDTLEITRVAGGPWPAESVPLRAAFDRAGQRVVVHDAYFIDRTEGVWILDLASERWSSLDVADAPGQLFHAPLTMSGPDRALLYSGYTGETGSDAVFELDLTSGRFARLPLRAEPGGRFSHRAVFDPVRGALFVVGGTLFTVDRGTLVLDARAPSIVEPVLDPAPGGRRDHTLVLDRRRRRAITFGGAEQSAHAWADTWALELP